MRQDGIVSNITSYNLVKSTFEVHGWSQEKLPDHISIDFYGYKSAYNRTGSEILNRDRC